MGGTISYDLDGAAESAAADLTAGDYAQLRGTFRNPCIRRFPASNRFKQLRISNASVRSPPGTGG